jgi:protein SCO1/2
MNTAADLSPVRAPHSWPALAWKLGLFLTPILIAAGLFFLRQVEVARLASNQLPDIGTVPAFQLVNQDNQSFGTEQLRDKIWIADFIYTRCPGPCPMISSRMGEVQKPLQNTDVKLVTFSVDPQRDTPQVLRDYAARLNAEPGRWNFLTGDRETIYRLAKDAFKLATIDDPQGPGPIHSTRMVLVDRRGSIRGYYDALDADAVTRLLADSNHLLKDQPAAK